MYTWLFKAYLSWLPDYKGKQVIIIVKKVYKIRFRRSVKIVAHSTITAPNKEIYVLRS